MDGSGRPTLSPRTAHLFSCVGGIRSLHVCLMRVTRYAGTIRLTEIVIGVNRQRPGVASRRVIGRHFVSLFLPLAPLFMSNGAIDGVHTHVGGT